MVYSFDRFWSKSSITAVNKFRTAKILKYFFFQWFQGSLFICISGKKWKCKGNAISIHEHSHLNDGVGTMFFAFAIFFVTIFLFKLKIIVCAIVIEDLIVAFSKQMAVLIHFWLDKIAFISQNIKSTVYIVQLIRRLFQKFRSSLIRRTFTGRFQDSGIDKIRKNRIDIIFKSMLIPEFTTGFI